MAMKYKLSLIPSDIKWLLLAEPGRTVKHIRLPKPRLSDCHSVLDGILADSDWWEQKGCGREMAFDLTSHSRSWDVLLLNYLYTALAEELP
jgi:hypothetical protein